MKLMNTIPTSKLTDNIYAIKNLYVNCFVYKKESLTILIDTASSVKAVKKGLEKIGIDEKTITHVFLTHGDMDHAGGLPLFTHSKIYLGKECPIKNPEEYNNEYLKDGTVVEIGSIRIKAIDNPGHRIGHTAFLIDDKYLFTGDAMKIKDGVVKPFGKMISSDFKTQVESIKKLVQLEGVEGIFTAHGGYTTNFEEAIKEWK